MPFINDDRKVTGNERREERWYDKGPPSDSDSNVQFDALTPEAAELLPTV